MSKGQPDADDVQILTEEIDDGARTRRFISRFREMKQIHLTVPRDFDPKIEFSTYRESMTPSYDSIHVDLTDHNFGPGNRMLRPGSHITLAVDEIQTQGTKSSTLLKRVRERHGLFIGPKGLSLVARLLPEELPHGKRTLAPDEAKHLWKDERGHLRTPLFTHGQRSARTLFLADMTIGFDPQTCIIYLLPE